MAVLSNGVGYRHFSLVCHAKGNLQPGGATPEVMRGCEVESSSTGKSNGNPRLVVLQAKGLHIMPNLLKNILPFTVTRGCCTSITLLGQEFSQE